MAGATAGWPEPHDSTQAVWFNWNKMDLDVLVIAVDDPVVGAAIAEGIARWVDGIEAGAPDLAERLEIRVHWADTGDFPGGLDVDILFVPPAFVAYDIGVGPRCVATAPMDGVLLWQSMVNTVAHEFGHCLGLTNAFEDGVEYEPAVDIMGSGDFTTHKCPSNLNLEILRMAFSGQQGELGMPAENYGQVAC